MSPKKTTAKSETPKTKATKAASVKKAAAPVASQKKTSKKPDTLQDKYRVHENDTGSTEVQIALISDRIGSLADHLKEHAKDHDSRRGLLMMVGKRRRLLNYLKKENSQSYQKLIADLGLRK